jgi:GTP-binding protein
MMNVPDNRKPGRTEPVSLIKIRSAELETVCGIKSSFPDHVYPEYAFAGKSNVGKSSLINTLVQRKALARTSATPGKTQTINFYKVGIRPGETGAGSSDDRILYMVDLPGYGYTKAAESVKADWGRMVERYLHQTKMLKTVFLLVDIRHKPTADDMLMDRWIRDQGFHPVIIATKADKLGKNEKAKALRLIRETFGLEKDDCLISFSAATREGREDLYRILLQQDQSV